MELPGGTSRMQRIAWCGGSVLARWIDLRGMCLLYIALPACISSSLNYYGRQAHYG
jgi:hypothetical protein